MLCLAACTPTAAPDPEPTAAAATRTPAQTPTQTPTEAPSDADDLQRCDREQRGALRAAVDGQLAAIATRRWDEALTYATPGFRSGIDAEAFAEIIVDEFPIVADAIGADVGRCALSATGDEAVMLVTVKDPDGAEVELTYLFELHASAWLIGGAVPAPPADTSTITV